MTTTEPKLDSKLAAEDYKNVTENIEGIVKLNEQIRELNKTMDKNVAKNIAPLLAQLDPNTGEVKKTGGRKSVKKGKAKSRSRSRSKTRSKSKTKTRSNR